MRLKKWIRRFNNNGFVAIPSYSKLNLNIFERIRDRQFALISTVSVEVDTNIVSPDAQTIKLKKTQRPKIGKVDSTWVCRAHWTSFKHTQPVIKRLQKKHILR